MRRRKLLFIFLILIIMAIIFLVLTLVKDRKSIIGYVLFSIFFIPALIFLYLAINDDSITKYRKNELLSFVKNHPELYIKNIDINSQNAYIEMDNNGNMVYISIFNKKAYLDIFDKEESKRLEYLEALEDESLKKEGFLALMQNKKGITLDIKNLSAEDIFFKIKANLR